MTILETGSTGGPFDELARNLAPLVSAYLHATVDVEDVTAANGIPGGNDIAAAPPNGLTIGVTNPFNAVDEVLTHTSGLNFNMGREAWVGETGPSTAVLVASPNSPFRSFKDLQDTKAPLRILVQSTGTVAALWESMFGVLRIPVQWVGSYSSLGFLVQGFLRGDGPLAPIALTNSGSLIAAGQARPLAVNLVPPTGTTYRSSLLGIPSFATIFKTSKTKSASQKKLEGAVELLDDSSGLAVILQTAIPGPQLTAARAAVAWAFRQSSFKSEMLADGLNPTFVDPVKAKADFNDALKEGQPLGCYIAGTCL